MRTPMQVQMSFRVRGHRDAVRSIWPKRQGMDVSERACQIERHRLRSKYHILQVAITLRYYNDHLRANHGGIRIPRCLASRTRTSSIWANRVDCGARQTIVVSRPATPIGEENRTVDLVSQEVYRKAAGAMAERIGIIAE
jgi:hypothetical protein